MSSTIATPLSLLLAFLLVVPAAADDHGAPGPDEHVHVVAEADLAGDHYYVVEDHGAVLLFRETNGVLSGGVDGTGLQPAWSCVDGGAVVYVHEDDDCENGVKTPPDEQITNGAILDLVHELEHGILG